MKKSLLSDGLEDHRYFISDGPLVHMGVDSEPGYVLNDAPDRNDVTFLVFEWAATASG